MIPSYYPLAREQHLSAIGLQAFLVKKKSRLRRISTGGRVGAANRTRTGDLRITNASLYQLSYIGLKTVQN